MPNRMTRCVTVLAVMLTAGVTLGEDWTQFRGPTGQGVSGETGLPAEWSTSKNVAWKVPIPGEGWSSPIIYKGRVYLTSAVKPKGGVGADRELRTLCLDAKTGKMLWNVLVFEQKNGDIGRIHKKNSHASPTPITDGKHLYVHFGTTGTACLTLDGKVVWKLNELHYDPRHGGGNSPVLVGDLIIINCDGYDVQFICAVNKTSGKIVWKKERPAVKSTKGFSFATPLVIEQGGKPRVISPATDQVVAYEPKTGEVIWKLNYDGFSVIPRPVFGHGLIFLSTGYMRPQMLAIKAGGSGNVTKTHLKWSMARGASNTPSPLLVGEELYFVSDRGGIASCVDAKTGRVHWQQRLGGNFSASPVYADGKIYFQSEEGVTTVVSPSTDYELLGKSDLKEKTYASFGIADKAIFLRTETQLYRIEKR